MSVYKQLVTLMALAMILLGLAMIVVTLSRGFGFGVGIILGLLFIAAGGGRLWMVRQRT